MREAGRAVATDQLRALGQVGRVEQLRGRDRHVAEVGDMRVDVGERDLHRLDLQVPALGGVGVERGDVEVLEDAERDQRGDPLAVRRDLVQAVAAIVHADGVDPVDRVAGEVGRAHRAAVRRRVGDQLRGGLALVEVAAPGRRDAPQRAGCALQHEALAVLGCAAARQEVLGEARLVLEDLDVCVPLALDDRRHRIAVFGVLDRRLQALLEGQAAELLVQRGPAGDAAGHRHRVPAAQRIDAAMPALEVVDVPGRGRRARRIQAMQLLSVPDDREGIRPQAVRAGFGQRDRRGRSNDRVDRIAAGGQHSQPGLCGERLRGRDDVAGEDRRADRRVGVVPVKVRGHREDSGEGGGQQPRRSARSSKPVQLKSKRSPSRGTSPRWLGPNSSGRST